MMLTSILVPQCMLMRRQKEALYLYSKLNTQHSTSQACQKRSCIITQPHLNRYLSQTQYMNVLGNRWMETQVHAPLDLIHSRAHHFPRVHSTQSGKCQKLRVSNQFTEKYILSNLGLCQPEINKINIPSPCAPGEETSPAKFGPCRNQKMHWPKTK